MASTDPYEGALFIPSGGPVWHWRALWRQWRWAGFKSELAIHLEQWKPPSEHLLLMGPSAGWCLPSSFLTRFKFIDAVDIDPLAPALFRFNHGLALARAGTSLTFHKMNLFKAFDSILEAYSEHAILFSNVLGQHLFHDEDQARAQATIEAVKLSLSKRYWASFHDRLSGAYPQGKEFPHAQSAKHAIESATLASDLGLSGQWLDHLTVNVLPEGTERHLMAWPLLADWLHIVEFGSVRPR
ncbi:MAG: hypothetical protein EBU34_08095 [Alphaproteobacteria bacterium]|nr:hypothetical protein [Beijerinckiaceae bacterium]NBQ39729.1 hypothetical protein [Alphaproteobacteria bacterium]